MSNHPRIVDQVVDNLNHKQLTFYNFTAMQYNAQYEIVYWPDQNSFATVWEFNSYEEALKKFVEIRDGYFK